MLSFGCRVLGNQRLGWAGWGPEVDQRGPQEPGGVWGAGLGMDRACHVGPQDTMASCLEDG
jgi:hypothetical protein